MLFTLSDIIYKFKKKEIFSKKKLNFTEGEHVLLHGKSGCGKTTLVNLMSGLLRPSSGTIFFENVDFSALSDCELDDLRSNNFGLIFQRLHLIGHLDVEQNLKLASKVSNAKNILSLIKYLGLEDKKKQLAKDLSVGEAQRVAIARAVANNPKVIFADEPTSALDDHNTIKVMELLFDQTQKNKSTLLVASHDDRIKKYFSRVVKM